MRLSQLLITRSATNDDNDLLERAGYTHRLADGLYTLLPLGHRVLQRISAIVREELDRAGAQEVAMPLLQPESLWDARASLFGPQLFRVKAENDERLVLAPTHEEVATIVASACIHDSRDLPRVLYQIQPRFRDQDAGSRSGLMRTREFVMADAYSFHAGRESLDQTYTAIRDAFCAILARCGVQIQIVRAGSGAMGGEESEELLASFPRAANTMALQCEECGYAASLEIAECAQSDSTEEVLPLEEIPVPDSLAPARRLMGLPFIAAGRVGLAVMPANRVLNPSKFAGALSGHGINSADCHVASAAELANLGGTYDWISIVRTPPSFFVIADESVRAGANFVLPSPRTGHFLKNVNGARDFRVDAFAGISFASEGDACVRCGKRLNAIRGTEVGHIFKLGNRYSAAFEMGCYGLGVTRLMQTIVEQNRDARGIVWPKAVAPYVAVIVPVNVHFAEQLYRSCTELEILLDDSDAELEEKIRRADLLGMPFQIIVPADGSDVEIRDRLSTKIHRVHSSNVAAFLHDLVPPYSRPV